MLKKLFNSFFPSSNSDKIKKVEKLRNTKATVIKMPILSDKMEYGIIKEWKVQKGDYVDAGDILLDIDTDKATMELEVDEFGTILYLAAENNETVDVGKLLLIIGNRGEDISELLKENS